MKKKQPESHFPASSTETPLAKAVKAQLPESEEAKEIYELLDEHSEWIRGRVRQRLGPKLRTKCQSGDIEQEALLRFLRYGPRLPSLNPKQFRHLMARIVENVIRDQHDWLHAIARDPSRELAGSQAENALNLQNAGSATPSAEAVRHEHQELVHFALGLLDPDDRRVIILRRWDTLSFDDIGIKLGINGPAADTRFRRAMRRFARVIRRVQGGEWDVIDAETSSEDPDQEPS
ncbi:MAG: sigma-70 family RNA polymerase sigma factor [Planctomycetota bacterium]